MRMWRATVALLGLVVAGCAGSAAPAVAPPTTSATQTPPPATATPADSTPSPPAPSASAAPSATAEPSPPPAPRAVQVTREGCYTGPTADGVPSGECRLTISWVRVATDGTELRVYGVTRCVLQERRAGSGECLDVDAAVPASARRLIASAAVSKGTVSWTRPAWLDNVRTDIGPPIARVFGVDRDGDDLYFAILVVAHNVAGDSDFILADSGEWCYDTGCEGP